MYQRIYFNRILDNINLIGTLIFVYLRKIEIEQPIAIEREFVKRTTVTHLTEIVFMVNNLYS